LIEDIEGGPLNYKCCWVEDDSGPPPSSGGPMTSPPSLAPAKKKPAPVVVKKQKQVVTPITKSCETCCDCMAFHEDGGQGNKCLEAQALTILCRQKYYQSPYMGKGPYKDVCNVVEDCGYYKVKIKGKIKIKYGCQYSGSDDSSGNYRQCKKGNISPVSVCQKVNERGLPSQSNCPVYATQRVLDDSYCEPGRKICPIPPTGKCGNSKYYTCILKSETCPKLPK